jgi:sugar phosphate isomerase/epimerase
VTSAPALIAGYWTLAGPVRPGEGGDVSPWPIVDRVRAAADAGFRGVGFYYDDLAAIDRSGGMDELRAVVADLGLEYGQFELGVAQWWGSGPGRQRADRMLDEMLRWVEALGLPDNHVKALPDFGETPVPTEVYVEGLADFAQASSRVGAPVGLEFLPYAHVGTVEDAWVIVEATGRADCGLVVDAWHVLRGTTSLDQLAAIPGDRIVNVELDDADREVRGTLIEDTIDHRRLCGEGAFDLPGLLAAIAATGYDKPYGLEIISIEHRARTLKDAAQRAYDTTAAQFAHITRRTP